MTIIVMTMHFMTIIGEPTCATAMYVTTMRKPLTHVLRDVDVRPAVEGAQLPGVHANLGGGTVIVEITIIP